MLDTALRLVELQADAGIPAEDRDFTGYVANVLFDDWDEEWADAARAWAAAGLVCAGAAPASAGLGASNILTDGGTDHWCGGLG